jgi:hypothetical protein
VTRISVGTDKTTDTGAHHGKKLEKIFKVRGEVAGEVRGEVAGEVRGEVAGDVRGEVAGEVRGEVAGRLVGWAGRSVGEVTGDPWARWRGGLWAR